MGYGSDPTIVMLRKNEPIDPNAVGIPSPLEVKVVDTRQRYGLERMVHHIRVVFCSKVYYGVEIDGQYFWQAHKLRDWVKSQKDLEIRIGGCRWSSRKKKYKLEEYFAVTEANEGLRQFMIKNRYAIVLERETERYKEPECRMNPYDLKKYGFMKALDPYTAYQELSMWVGGVLAGESPHIVKVTSDRVLLEGHGFDNVFSFRGPRIR
jgi:hypothetical protein